MTDPLIRAAVARWDEVLAAGGDDWVAGALQSQFDSGQAPKGIPLCRVARPNFATAASIAADQEVLSAVADALVSAGRRLLAEPALAERYLGDWWKAEGHDELLRVDSGYSEPMVLGRFDTAQTPNGLRVLEFNGGMPGGLANTEAAAAMVSQWPVFEQFAAEFDVEQMPLLRKAGEGILKAYSDFGGTGLPLMALAIPDEILPLAAAHLPGFISTAEAIGCELVVTDPSNLVRSGGQLLIDGRPVGVVIRAFFNEMLGFLGDRVRPLLDAVAAGEVCMVTSLSASIYGHKGLFAAITDPALDLGLPAAQAAAVQEHLPWTRMARDETTTDPHGDSVNLAAFMASRREHLVLKPANGFGGMGVNLGWEMQQAEWEAVIATSLAAGDHIVQDRISVPTQSYPELAAGLPVHDYLADYNPIIINREIIGYFVRLSRDGGITNVSGGTGTLTPTFRLN